MAFLLFQRCWKGFKLEPIQTSQEAWDQSRALWAISFPMCWHRKHVDGRAGKPAGPAPRGLTEQPPGLPGSQQLCPPRAAACDVFQGLCWSWSISKAADPFSSVVILLVIEIPFFMTLLGLILESVYSLDFIKLCQKVSVQPRGLGEGWSGSLGLADVNFSIHNGYITRSYCIASYV